MSGARASGVWGIAAVAFVCFALLALAFLWPGSPARDDRPADVPFTLRVGHEAVLAFTPRHEGVRTIAVGVPSGVLDARNLTSANDVEERLGATVFAWRILQGGREVAAGEGRPAVERWSQHGEGLTLHSWAPRAGEPLRATVRVVAVDPAWDGARMYLAARGPGYIGLTLGVYRIAAFGVGALGVFMLALALWRGRRARAV